MVKVQFVVYEGTKLAREAALAYWRTTHGEVARKIPGVQSYVQHHALTTPDGKTPPFLGVATMTFADEATFAAAAGSPEFAAAVADLGNFGGVSNLPTVLAEDHTIV
jgi:uncharacterized protein (TIGR02118 family)